MRYQKTPFRFAINVYTPRSALTQRNKKTPRMLRRKPAANVFSRNLRPICDAKWIEETPQTQVAIGSITTDEEHRDQFAPEIQLTLLRAAFTDFWNATSSTDSAPRN